MQVDITFQNKMYHNCTFYAFKYIYTYLIKRA
jgi:hypothetical protein